MIGLSDYNLNLIVKKLEKMFSNVNNKNYNSFYKYFKNIKKLSFPKYVDGCLLNIKEYTEFFLKNIEYNEIYSNINKFIPQDAYKIVFFNGIFIPLLSNYNLKIWKLKTRKKFYPKKDVSNYRKFKSIFDYINYFLRRKFVIELLKNNISNKVLYLVHLSKGFLNKDTLNMICYNRSIKIQDNTYGKIIEYFISLDDMSCCLHSMYNTINIERNSKLDFIKVILENKRNFHISKNIVTLQDNAIIKNRIFLFNSKISYDKTKILFCGEKSNADFKSLSFSSNKNLNIIDAYLDHKKPFCIGTQLHKFITFNKGKVVFYGLINIIKDLYKIDSIMNIKSLMLDSLSQVILYPRLKIYSNNVQCGHSATISQIDDKHEFYLCTRGINKIEARRMLIYAFIYEMFHDVKNQSLHKFLSIHANNILQGVLI